GESALAEGDRAGAAALGTRLRLRAGRIAAAVAGGAIVRDRDTDVDLATARRRREGDLDDVLHVAATRRRAGPRAAPLLAARPVEEGAEQIAETAEIAEVVDREALLACGGAGRAAGRATPPKAEAAERPHLAHLVVLLAL